MPSPNAVLEIDLGAIAANVRLLRERAGAAALAPAVKADAYGLGLEQVAPVLAAAGAETFYVAQLQEAVALRRRLPRAEIRVLAGCLPGEERLFIARRLVPVLNTLDQLALWRAAAAMAGRALPAVLHVDTGMARLGLSDREVAAARGDPALLDGLAVTTVMSHLACADSPAHPLNARQRAAFQALAGWLPRARRSLANSSGIFLGADYRFDEVRPGYALYGGNPTPDAANPMRPVVGLKARILQVRCVDSGTCVGYGAAHRVAKPARLATVGLGYADGFHRALSNRGHLYLEGVPLPIAGRVSMDLTVVDVSELPESKAVPGALLEVIGPSQSLDALAGAAGTIGYELLAGLGRRYGRSYRGL